MISENSINKIPFDSFLKTSARLGIALAVNDSEIEPNFSVFSYIDLEVYFLAATYNLKNSRIAEGFISWLLRYGNLLSPSKVRRLIQVVIPYDSSHCYVSLR